jgi:hypothetical protein
MVAFALTTMSIRSSSRDPIAAQNLYVVFYNSPFDHLDWNGERPETSLGQVKPSNESDCKSNHDKGVEICSQLSHPFRTKCYKDNNEQYAKCIETLVPWGATTTISYGYYCGPTRRASCKFDGTPYLNPKPIDDVDLACAYHDCCLPTVSDYCDRTHHRGCNLAFCIALLLADCSKAPDPKICDEYRTRALELCAGTIDFWPFPLP